MSIMGLLSKANVKDYRTKQWMRGGRRLLILEGKHTILLFQVALVAFQFS